MLKDLETALSSSQRRTKQREVPRDRPTVAPASVLAGAAAVGAEGRVAEAAHTPLGGAGVGIAGLNPRKFVEVSLAINEDKNEWQSLKFQHKRLEKSVASFAVFCRDHIDLVLSSDLAEGEFSSLLYILRGIHSPGAAANAQLPLHVLVNKEVNIHDTRVSTLMEQFHWRFSSANQELSSITQQILHELQEGPNYDEIQTMITNFIEAKFSEACES